MRKQSPVIIIQFLFLLITHPQAMAKRLPQACLEAVNTHDSTMKVRLFTQCINTNLLTQNDNSTAFAKRGEAYFAIGKYKQSFPDFNRAIHFNPENAEAYNDRGGYYSTIGKNDSAIKDVDTAIRRTLSRLSLTTTWEVFIHDKINMMTRLKTLIKQSASGHFLQFITAEAMLTI